MTRQINCLYIERRLTVDRLWLLLHLSSNLSCLSWEDIRRSGREFKRWSRGTCSHSCRMSDDHRRGGGDR